jgi:hypothetical protein
VYGKPPGWKGIWKRGDIGLISKWATGKSGRERDFVRARHRRGNFRSIAVITVCVAVLATISGGAMQLEAMASLPPSLIETQLDSGLNPRDQAVADQLASRFAEQVSNVEWLAPLAPIALSPFFGLTLLSGLACYGPDWLPDNPLLSGRSPFSDPRFFWIFLVLTVVTSLPRFSKVSKPIAQLADFLETWSAIVILVFIRLFAVTTEAPETEMAVQAGILSVGWQGLLIVAMVMNLIVINSVKFFFEFLVWITPIPMLDACFEIVNKAFCVALMAVYAFSPLIALLLNLLLFVACLMVFFWIRRREFFYRTMLIDWVTVWLKGVLATSSTNARSPHELVVFPQDRVGDIPARARCRLQKQKQMGWSLVWNRWFRHPVVEEFSGPARLESGWWTNTIVMDNGKRLTFGRRGEDELAAAASAYSLDWTDGRSPSNDPGTARRVDFV